MPTFLQICQNLSRESGIVSGALPATVVGQTGNLLKIVNWVNDAWNDIQNLHATWLWMRSEWSNNLSVNTSKYTPASFNLTDFSRWVTDPRSVTLYLTATGVSDEGEIRFIPWHEWRIKYDRGTQTANRPVDYSISPMLEFSVGPKPDLVYTARGEYYAGNQDLTLDADVPNMPARFHKLIVWRALVTLHNSTEGDFQFVNAKNEYDNMLFNLERDQLPDTNISAASVLA